VIVTDVLVAYAGTEIEPPVGAALSSVRVKVVSAALLAAASVPWAASEPLPEAVVQLMAVES
jgi:hypothetical protein